MRSFIIKTTVFYVFPSKQFLFALISATYLLIKYRTVIRAFPSQQSFLLFEVYH